MAGRKASDKGAGHVNCFLSLPVSMLGMMAAEGPGRIPDKVVKSPVEISDIAMDVGFNNIGDFMIRLNELYLSAADAQGVDILHGRITGSFFKVRFNWRKIKYHVM